jgi:hypothetical protein
MRGGKRIGAGRKPGVSLLKRAIREHFSQEDMDELIEQAKKMAKTRPEMLKFLIEQVYGRAPQRIELGADIPPEIQISWKNSGPSESVGNAAR